MFCTEMFFGVMMPGDSKWKDCVRNGGISVMFWRAKHVRTATVLYMAASSLQLLIINLFQIHN